MIDLGELRDAQARVPRAPLPTRWFLAGLSIVLLAVLGGAAWDRPPAVIAASLQDSTQIVGDRLFLFHPAGDHQVISWYRLPQAEPLGTVNVGLTGDIVAVLPVGEVFLVTSQTDGIFTSKVVAVAAGSGRELWRRDAVVEAVAPGNGTALLTDVKGWTAVDVADGRARWAVPYGTSSSYDTVAYSTADNDTGGYPTRIFTLHGDRVMAYDAGDGRFVASLQLPAGHGSFLVAGDLVLVGVGGATTAYRKADLTPVWHSGIDLRQNFALGDCRLVICVLHQQRGVTAVDPANGSVAWSSDQWSSAQAIGDRIVATVPEGLQSPAHVWVLDPRTGRVLGNFGDWQAIGQAENPVKITGTEFVYGGHAIRYGELDPVTLRIKVLGTADRISGDCAAGARALVCREIDSSIVVIPLG